jgi:hypothetical protein
MGVRRNAVPALRMLRGAVLKTKPSAKNFHRILHFLFFGLESSLTLKM